MCQAWFWVLQIVSNREPWSQAMELLSRWNIITDSRELLFSFFTDVFFLFLLDLRCPVLSYLCTFVHSCIASWQIIPKFSGLKQIFGTVSSVRVWPWFGWVLLIWGLSQAIIKVIRAVVISRLNWGRILFQSPTHSCWQDSVPLDCWNEGLSASLVIGWASLCSLLCEPLHWAAHNMVAGFP